MTPKEDAIARSRRVLEAVDRYCELPTSGTRHALRSLLLDEFNAALGVPTSSSPPKPWHTPMVYPYAQLPSEPYTSTKPEDDHS